jgi:predicted ATPase
VAHFADGVFLVELAAVVDPDLVVPTIARALGLAEQPGLPVDESVRAYVRHKRLLLLLDNFEQVLDAASEVVRLLQAGPALKVLVTSREALHVRGERRFRVPPLALPAVPAGGALDPVALSRSPAVQLFVESAQAVQSDFQLTLDNMEDVLAVCTRLDGLPLALELAAAHVSTLPARQLREALGQGRKFSTGSARDLPARHRTLLAAIEWSYNLLNPAEQRLYRRVGVFVGGHTLAALEAVCHDEGSREAEVLEGVESLVNKSLLQPREGANGVPRFMMLETIHEHARAKLQESEEAPALQREHARYFMGLAVAAERQLRGARQEQGLEMVAEAYDNLRAALAWSSEQAQGGDREGAEIGLRTTGALWRFWVVKGLFTEGRAHLERALAAPAALLQECSSALRARALNGAGSLAFCQGDYAAAHALSQAALLLGSATADKESMASSLNNLANVAQYQGDRAAAWARYEQSLALWRELGDKWGIANAVANLGFAAQDQGDYATARARGEESLALRRELGDQWGIASALSNLGDAAHLAGDYATARTLLEESLILQRELGDQAGSANSVNGLGIVAWQQGDYALARALFAESLAHYREFGDRWGSANALSNLGLVACEQGEYPGARALLAESLALRRELGNTKGIAVSLAGLAGVAVGVGQPERGATLLGAVAGLLQRIGAVLDSEDRRPYERTGAAVRALLGAEVFERLWREGQAMSMEQATAYALASGPGGLAPARA